MTTPKPKKQSLPEWQDFLAALSSSTKPVRNEKAAAGAAVDVAAMVAVAEVAEVVATVAGGGGGGGGRGGGGGGGSRRLRSRPVVSFQRI